jgi:hypothetical protein
VSNVRIIVNDRLGEIWTKELWPRYCPDICIAGLKTKKLFQAKDSNMAYN